MPLTNPNSAESNDPLSLLKQYGDLLERTMFKDDQFAGCFSAYPKVWARHILPNRAKEQPTVTTKSWMRLAEHNYTAIVRCWNVKQANLRITEICTHVAANGPDGDLFLALQEALLAFFCCAGGAIDNLRNAFAVEPVCSPKTGNATLYESATGWGSLKWIYARRTQSVHKVLIPCFLSQGVPHFDASLFIYKETRWDKPAMTDIQSVDDLQTRIWRDFFVPQMNSAWHVLFDHLRTADSSLPFLPVTVNIVPYNLEWSSGTPMEPDGSPYLSTP
jgi:hypothetical protein